MNASRERMSPRTVAIAAAVALALFTGCGDNDDNDAPAIDLLRLPALHAVADPIHGGRFVDDAGRHVILRGVNVNGFVEYWQGTPFPTTFPFSEEDAERIAAIGWNVVRLLTSWSRVEPEPGIYDEAYIDSLHAAVRTLEAQGIYSIIDLHQDAWGPTLAARPDEVCGPSTTPALGWDGAPGWATLDGGRSRCTPGQRELSPAVVGAFRAFWANASGPGNVGIRTRYTRMLAHLAAGFAGDNAVAGFDVMNEPNSFTPSDEQGLALLHGEAWQAIRDAQAGIAGPGHVVIFEPTALWASFRVRPLDFPRDDNVAYAPHLYQGGLDTGPLAPQFDDARADAAAFGGVPVLTGEWGSGPDRAANPSDTYFRDHQRMQDEYLFGATLWTWRESCGDPHKAADYLAGRTAYVWGEFEVDCRTNEILGPRQELIDQLTRGYVRAGPGRVVETVYDPADGSLRAAGVDADAGTALLAFYPASIHGEPIVSATGLGGLRTQIAAGGNLLISATASGGSWTLTAR